MDGIQWKSCFRLGARLFLLSWVAAFLEIVVGVLGVALGESIYSAVTAFTQPLSPAVVADEDESPKATNIIQVTDKVIPLSQKLPAASLIYPLKNPSLELVFDVVEVSERLRSSAGRGMKELSGFQLKVLDDWLAARKQIQLLAVPQGLMYPLEEERWDLFMQLFSEGKLAIRTTSGELLPGIIFRKISDDKGSFARTEYWTSEGRLLAKDARVLVCF